MRIRVLSAAMRSCKRLIQNSDENKLTDHRLDYSRWANCPPRAPLGKADAVYGSFDHLILLLGRIADFAARDRVRKLKVMDANGGQWRPAPGVKMPGQPPGPPPPPPPAAPGHQQANGGAAAPQPPGPQPANGPQFYGMA